VELNFDKITIFETATITQQTEIPMGQGYPKKKFSVLRRRGSTSDSVYFICSNNNGPTSSPMAPTAPNTNTPNTSITPKVSNALQLVVSSIGILSGLLLLRIEYYFPHDNVFIYPIAILKYF
jgi:hypothetical protein